MKLCLPAEEFLNAAGVSLQIIRCKIKPAIRANISVSPGKLIFIW